MELGLAGSVSLEVCLASQNLCPQHIQIRQVCLHVELLSFPLLSPDIQLLHEDFIELEPGDPRLEKAKVILLLPQCSGLGVGNPIDFIINERGGNF